MLDPLNQKPPTRMSPNLSDFPVTAEVLTLCTIAEALYQSFLKAVKDAQSDITEFTELMQEDESKEVFAQAQKSQQQDPTDIKPWRHRDHPGWYDFNGKS